jgi:hypothetical protein
MTLRDVGKMQEMLSEIIPAIQSHIDNDEIESMMVVINSKNNDGIHQYRFMPSNINAFEWIGILEYLKQELMYSVEE